MGKVCFLLLLAAWGSTVLAGTPLNVYQTCIAPDGVRGTCRQQQAVLAGPSDVKAGAVLELPVDMRLPCTDAKRGCAENVDVALTPVQAPTGDDVASCKVTLMPWSPFPCTFNTGTYKGVEGQNQTNYCYSKHTKPDLPGFEFATDLTTDGYSNLFHGGLPDVPCAHGFSSSGSNSSSPLKQQPSNHVGAAATGQQPGYGLHFSKVLLTVNFRVAAGRQFDRTFSFQIGRAVAALGTLTEPTRWLGTDKWWSTTTDITHLQSYLAPGLPTRLSLANLLSNTYNVPLWAEVTLTYYWPQPAPSTGHTQAEAAGAGAAEGGSSKSNAAGGHEVPAAAGGDGPAAHAAAVGAAPAGVPDEVVPLVPSPEDFESLVVLAGRGDSPQSWPRATFKLDPALSEPGNIYRAQLLVTPKADSCEEFWAMNPSGPGTNNTCGGQSTGEPYREVRVYINNQLAAFSPIYYTMYTGGVDPRLWSAIVASYTYSLPTYTFDLSPWLPQLNARPVPSSSSSSSKGPATTTDRRSSSSGADGVTDSHPAVGVGVEDSRLPQHLNQPAATRRLSHSNVLQQPQPTDSHPAAAAVAAEPGAHTVTVELVGATGSNWMVANTLLLWRAVGSDGQPEAVSGSQQPQIVTSSGFFAPLQSHCSPSNGSELSVAGKCSLVVQDRSMEASAVLTWRGQEWEARVRYATPRYDNIITFNNDVNVTDGSLTWYQETHHEASWSVERLKPSGAGPPRGPQTQPQDQNQQQQQQHLDNLPSAAALADVLTQSAVRYDWLNTGNVTAGGAFAFSYNATLQVPSVMAAHRLYLARGSSSPGGAHSSSSSSSSYHPGLAVVTGSQRHYQQALMLNVYTPTSPKCVVPDNATHTVSLHNSISSSQGWRGVGSSSKLQQDTSAAGSCVRRWGSCGFCGARLMSNVVELDAEGC